MLLVIKTLAGHALLPCHLPRSLLMLVDGTTCTRIATRRCQLDASFAVSASQTFGITLACLLVGEVVFGKDQPSTLVQDVFLVVLDILALSFLSSRVSTACATGLAVPWTPVDGPD